MHRLVAAGTIALLSIVLSSTSVVSQPVAAANPDPIGQPGPTREEAVALVLAQDARFTGLPDYERQRVKQASMDLDAVIGSGYYRVLPTATTLWPRATVDMDTFVFRQPRNWLVEASLVQGCMEMVGGQVAPLPDPCDWRHAWYYRVHPDGTVTLLFEEGDPLPVPTSD